MKSTLFIYGQRQEQITIININSKFKLTLSKSDSLHFSYKVESNNPYSKSINLMKHEKLLSQEVGKNEIQCIFSKSKIENNTVSVLLLKSGIPNPLEYDLEIKSLGNQNPTKTSTTSLFPNVVSIEVWPFEIDYLIISNIRVGIEKEPPVIEVAVDSSCIKNPTHNIIWGDRLFSQYIDTIKKKYISQIGLNMNRVIKYEESIKSEEKTRRYHTSIGEGIYPNKNNYKLEQPIRYRRVECPSFDVSVSYYYTEVDKSVKVILFEWNEFKEKDELFKNEINEDHKIKAFREKFSVINNKMTNILGKPYYVNMESKKNKPRFRDDIKWKGINGIEAYLFMFGGSNSYSRYKQIRLAIYKN